MRAYLFGIESRAAARARANLPTTPHTNIDTTTPITSCTAQYPPNRSASNPTSTGARNIGPPAIAFNTASPTVITVAYARPRVNTKRQRPRAYNAGILSSGPTTNSKAFSPTRSNKDGLCIRIYTDLLSPRATGIKLRRTVLMVAFTASLITCGVVLLASEPRPARVLAKQEHIQVRPSTGQWYHSYDVLIGVRNANAITDSQWVHVGQTEYDATRTGAHVKLARPAFAKRLSWISDSTSKRQSLAHFIAARMKSYSTPIAISPLDVQTSGLARVVAVHSIERRTPFWKKQGPNNGSRSRWLHLVEVEFWAPRTRSLVRTIDVIDAGSIPGLHAGDIVQMHYDQREPRVLRLDDGMRTFAAWKH